MVSRWLPQGSNTINFATDVLESKHVCSRECTFEKVCGNVWRCTRSFLVHVCDRNCNQRVPLDNYTEICRLSKQTFARSMISSVPSRKRFGGEEEQHEEQCVKRQNSGLVHQPLMEVPAWEIQARCLVQQQQQQLQQQPGCPPWGMSMDTNQQTMCWQP